MVKGMNLSVPMVRLFKLIPIHLRSSAFICGSNQSLAK
jgi:hypothetical protein